MLSSQYHDVFAVNANYIVNTTEIMKKYNRHSDINSVKREGQLSLKRANWKQIQDRSANPGCEVAQLLAVNVKKAENVEGVMQSFFEAWPLWLSGKLHWKFV